MNSKFTNARIVFNNDKTSSKPFCKVCYDANQKGYDTHYVRSKVGSESVVVCPYLLSLECGYCHNPGHTVKYCDMLASRGNKTYEPAPVPAASYKKKVTVTTEDGWTTRASPSKPVPGKFRIVGLEDEPVSKPEPEPVAPAVEEPKFEHRDFPALTAGWALPDESAAKGTSWASIAASVPPKPRAKLSMAEANTITAAIDVASSSTAKTSSPPVPAINKSAGKKTTFEKALAMKPTSNWADSSSDDEDW